ncbi:hypothetical protein [Streptomyces beihaiensis]|uniref:Uncharacterized protein n=1 Tax=Streptomyces beihaiensis TaxID=2984495 RepID=A0ABT3TW10_9ACTN|nr:hypothetical protein [Streptomyces beihaiensis]MCX3061224.1 hypothetical protein [Streptomyces beihaiensis]
MAKKNTPPALAPASAWFARGCHVGPEPEQDLRRNLIALRAAGVLDDFLDLDPVEAARSTVLHPRDQDAGPGASARRLFEARWRLSDDVTVRAQLTTYEPQQHRRKDGAGVAWVLAAQAERVWDELWPSPATMFWPDSDRVEWDHEAVPGLPGLRLRAANRLPKDDDEVRRLLRECVRDGWYVHVVVHEAMTPDAQGQQPVTRFLPPGLRHRVVEHRATPEQAQIADFALKRDLGVRLPRGGAVVLPTVPPVEGYEAERFTVRNVFLDGSEPAELLARIVEAAASARPLPDEAEQALTRLRKGWHLLTPDEELAHAQDMVAKYAEALEAMTLSRDRYREAAEAAQAALAETGGADGAPRPPSAHPARKADGSPLNVFAKTFGRFRDPAK